MSRPTPAEEGSVFDLAALAWELREEDAYVRDGHTAKTLLREPDLRVMLIVLRAESQLSEHRAHVTATVQVLAGRVSVELPDRSAEVGFGQMIVLGPGVLHEVHSHVDSTLLLTLGWREERN